jgi:hypothetical protein
LGRLIIFPTHEISCGIHASSLIRGMDNRCPMHARIDAGNFPAHTRRILHG